MIPKMKIRRLFEPLISTIYAFLPRNNAEMQIELLHRQGTIVKGTTEKYCFYDYSWVKYSNNLANSWIWKVAKFGSWEFQLCWQYCSNMTNHFKKESKLHQPMSQTFLSFTTTFIFYSRIHNIRSVNRSFYFITR